MGITLPSRNREGRVQPWGHCCALNQTAALVSAGQLSVLVSGEAPTLAAHRPDERYTGPVGEVRGDGASSARWQGPPTPAPPVEWRVGLADTPYGYHRNDGARGEVRGHPPGSALIQSRS